MLKFIRLPLLLLLLLPPWLHAGEPVPAAGGVTLGATLPELLVWQEEHHPALTAADLDAEAATAQAEAAGILPDPRFSVELMGITNPMTASNFTLDPERVDSTKYTIAQEFPWWGKLDLMRGMAREAAEESRQMAGAKRVELRSMLTAAFANHYLVVKTRELTREMITIMADLERFAVSRYRSGLGMQQEAVMAQVELTMLDRELATLAAEERMSGARVNEYLNRPPEAPLAAPRELPPLPPLPGVAELIARLERNNPELAAAAARVRMAEAERDLTYRERYPDLMVGLSPVQRGERVEEWQLMFSAEIPLQQGRKRAQERAAEARLRAASARRDGDYNMLRAAILEQHAQFTSRAEQVELLRSTLLPQVETGFQAALAGYETGGVGFDALVESRHQLQEVRFELLENQVQQHINRAELTRLTGDEP